MIDFELVRGGLRFPEGPIALRDGSVMLVESARGTLTRVAADGTATVVAETGGCPNGAAVGPDGAIYVVNNGGAYTWRERDGRIVPGATPAEHRGGSVQRIDPRTGECATLYDACDGQRLIAPNDLVFDRAGGFWFTDSGCTTPGGRRHGALYHALPDGSNIVRAHGGFIFPNGIGLAPDERVLYMADTVLGRLWAFDIETPGVLAPQPTPFSPGRAICTLPGHQMCDSLAVEADGRVCVATMDFQSGATGITVMQPDGNAEFHALPGAITTNICFGGNDGREAWITCGGSGELYRARWPRPGLALNFNL